LGGGDLKKTALRNSLREIKVGLEQRKKDHREPVQGKVSGRRGVKSRSFLFVPTEEDMSGGALLPSRAYRDDAREKKRPAMKEKKKGRRRQEAGRRRRSPHFKMGLGQSVSRARGVGETKGEGGEKGEAARNRGNAGQQKGLWVKKKTKFGEPRIRKEGRKSEVRKPGCLHASRIADLGFIFGGGKKKEKDRPRVRRGKAGGADKKGNQIVM